jgi:hypothetical protein
VTRSELDRRLRAAGYQIDERQLPRVMAYALGQPQQGRPAGAPGHREYSELDYRLVVSWLRVHDLCGFDREPVGMRVRRQVVDLLAYNRRGYVSVSNGEVGWSVLPPVGALRNGVATCWPVWE